MSLKYLFPYTFDLFNKKQTLEKIELCKNNQILQENQS
jgi:hypothetical protein